MPTAPGPKNTLFSYNTYAVVFVGLECGGFGAAKGHLILVNEPRGHGAVGRAGSDVRRGVSHLGGTVGHESGDENTGGEEAISHERKAGCEINPVSV